MKIAIASGKGGTGKTFLSTNLFRTMEQSGLCVTLVDCDAEVPNSSVFIRREKLKEWNTRVFCPEIDNTKCSFCGICSDHCNFHAITCIPMVKYIKVLPDLCHGCKACLIDCPEQAVSSAWKNIGKITAYGDNEKYQLIEARINEGEHSPVPVIRDAILRGKETNSEYLILDAPPGCSCPFVNTVMDADLVILITEPTPFGLSDLKHTVEVLRKLNKTFSVVINRSDLGNGTLKEYLKKEKIELLAEIPYSEEIASIYSKGDLAVDIQPKMRDLFINLMEQVREHETGNY